MRINININVLIKPPIHIYAIVGIWCQLCTGGASECSHWKDVLPTHTLSINVLIVAPDGGGQMAVPMPRNLENEKPLEEML